ncbi:Protein kinase A anchor protein nuclear localization signal domain-containing protein [Entamoeba marina]
MTANQSLDDVLCGGIPLGSLTQVVEFPGCGKTNCDLKVLSGIRIIKPTNLFELSALILSLSDKKWNIKLIVIDSLASLHKNTTFLEDNGVSVNCITSLMNNILSYATTYNVAVVEVNHLTNKKIDYNINIRFESNAENQIIDFVNEITSLSGIENYIDFTKCAPHVTLYLTSFPEDKIDEISVVVAQTLREMRGCHIHPTTMYVSGSYFMWTVEKNECLQLLSDTIVNATAQYRNTSYECPGWVYGLPDGESKERKIKYCELYSSPNVFEEFDPHITLVYNDKDDMAVLETYSPLSLNEESIRISNAPTGNYGTVPRNTEVFFIYLYPALVTF